MIKLQISEELKQLYRDDWLPKRETVLEKELFLYFPDLELTLSESNGIEAGTFKLTESICEESDLVFGGCYSSELKVTLYDIVQDLTGKKVVVWQMVENKHRMDLGTFVVESAKKKASNPMWKELIAYDETKVKLDKDCSRFYEDFFKDNQEHTLKEFRISLFRYCGIEIMEQNLINDSMKIEKAVDIKNVTGRTLAKSIGEINGVFGLMGRDNIFSYIVLTSDSLYPSEKLYPSEYIYPAMENEIFTENEVPYYASDSKYSEFETTPIDIVKIHQEEGDVGAVSGDGSNGYIVTGNIFCFDKSPKELQKIADNLLLIIRGVSYKPHTTKMIGLPYILPGARYIILTENDTIETYVFKRILSSPQGWNDEVSAKGNERRSEKVSPNQEIIQLKGKYFKILKDVDGLELEVGDLQKGYSKITVDISEINTEVSNLENHYSSIRQTVNEINLEVGKKVDSNSIISAINLSNEGIKIEGSKVNITGYVTFDDLATGGSSIISGDNITTGTINANLVKVENIDVNSITHNKYLKIITVNAANEFSIGSTAAYGLMPTITHILGREVELYSTGGSGINLRNNTIQINSNKVSIGSGINCEFNSGNLTSNSGSLRFVGGDFDTLTVRNSLSMTNGTLNVQNLKVSSEVNFPNNIRFNNLSVSGLTVSKIDVNGIDANDIEVTNGFRHRGNVIGFFGYSPTSKKSVSQLSGSSNITTVQSKVNEIISAFKSYGLL